MLNVDGNMLNESEEIPALGGFLRRDTRDGLFGPNMLMPQGTWKCTRE
jgi:hypothetical protein